MTLPKVVLIGDSIRIGYQESVAAALEGVADVWGPEANGSHSFNVLLNLHAWVRARQPDVVHINAGLHDIKTVAFDDRENVVPVSVYALNVQRLIGFIQRHSAAKVIWATMTPVIDAEHHASHVQADDFNRYEADVQAYNEAAVHVAGSMGVAINDLHAIASDFSPEDRTGDGAHFSPHGSGKLGDAVAMAIRGMLDADAISED